MCPVFYGSTMALAQALVAAPTSGADSAAAYDGFISFQWDSLAVAQVLNAGLCARGVRTWFAMEQDAASPAEMEAGVAASSFFIFVATQSALLSSNVRHEMSCAVAAGKRVLCLVEQSAGGEQAAPGARLEELLADPQVRNYTQNDQVGRRYLDAAGIDTFAARARALPPVAYYRDERLLSDTVPRVLEALAALAALAVLEAEARAAAAEAAAAAAGKASPAAGTAANSAAALPVRLPAAPLCPPYRMRTLRPPAGHCDVLLVAGASGLLQALYLAEALRMGCSARALEVRVLPPGSTEAASTSAVRCAGAVVLVLSKGVWSEAGYAAAAGEALKVVGLRVALMHEEEVRFGGAMFDEIMAATPDALKQQLYSSGTAGMIRRKRAEAELMVWDLLEKVGAVRRNAQPELLAPPPLPEAYIAAPGKKTVDTVRAAVAASPRPAGVVLHGLMGAGKTTLASGVALDAAVAAQFDDVVWVTVGKKDCAGMVGVLESLLEALEPARGAAAAAAAAAARAGASRDPLTAAVQRLQRVCARRAVLLVVDDVQEATTGGAALAPDAVGLLLQAVDVEPEGGSARASVALFTGRKLSVRRERPGVAGVAGRGVIDVGMGELEPAEAAKYVAEALRLKSVPEMGGLLRALEKLLPYSLTLAAACVTAKTGGTGVTHEAAIQSVSVLLQPPRRAASWCCWPSPQVVPLARDPGGGPASYHGALDAAIERCEEPAYKPIFRGLHASLTENAARKNWNRFGALGLFGADTYVPEAVLAVCWGGAGGEGFSPGDTTALLLEFQKLGLVKWEQHAKRAKLHDLAHEFAVDMLGEEIGGKLVQHASLVDKCEAAKLEDAMGAEGVWWRGAELEQLRAAGRVTQATDRVWSLPWLQRRTREWGGARLARVLEAQLEWETKEAKMSKTDRVAEIEELRLLKQVVVALVGAGLLERGGWGADGLVVGERGADGLAAQLIGRLGSREGAPMGGQRCAKLVEMARKWKGGGRPWLMPVRPNFAAPGGVCEGVMEGHAGEVACVCALGDTCVVSASGDRTLRVWDVATGACVRMLEGHTGVVSGVCALEDGRVVSASEDMTLRVWDTALGACVKVLKGHEGHVLSVCALADGRVVSGSDDKTLRVWELETEKCAMLLEGHTGAVTNVCALKDGRVASASDDTTLRVWDTETRKCTKVLEGHKDSVKGVCALDDGRVASASSDKTLRVWEVDTGAHVVLEGKEGKEGHTAGLRGVCALSGGRVVSVSSDKTLRVWEAAKNSLVRVLSGHEGAVMSVCATSNARIVSASQDKSLRVWDGAMGKYAREVEGHAGAVTSARERHEGLVSTERGKLGDLGTVKFWDPSTGACTKTLKDNTKQASEFHALYPLGKPGKAGGIVEAYKGAPSPFAPWGDETLPVHLGSAPGSDVLFCIFPKHADGRRTATAFTQSGAVHTVELVAGGAPGGGGVGGGGSGGAVGGGGARPA